MKELKKIIAAIIITLSTIGVEMVYRKINFSGSLCLYQNWWKAGMYLTFLYSETVIVASLLEVYKTSLMHLVTSCVVCITVMFPAMHTVFHLKMEIKLAIIGLIAINKIILDLISRIKRK